MVNMRSDVRSRIKAAIILMMTGFKRGKWVSAQMKIFSLKRWYQSELYDVI